MVLHPTSIFVYVSCRYIFSIVFRYTQKQFRKSVSTKFIDLKEMYVLPMF
jgi:hypothetical protein